MKTKIIKTMFFLAVVSIFCLFLDYVTGTVIIGGSLAMAMMSIGDVDDVSDRMTHGSNIAYKLYLIDISQIDDTKAFPMPNSSREVSSIPMKDGQYMKYFVAHDIPTFSSTGEKGDITTSGTNTFTAIMGGMRNQLLDFIEQHAGGKFIILFKEVGDPQWYILGSYDRPMVLSSYESKNDKDGRYVTINFSRTSIDQYYKYTGEIVRVPAAAHTADQTTLAIKSTNDRYTIPDGSSSTYEINAISGLSANDKGRYITLEGTGTDKSATIADGNSFIMEDGVTWTAKSGSSITFHVLDPQTLVEVPGSRVQIL